jgi:hypothetical protein
MARFKYIGVTGKKWLFIKESILLLVATACLPCVVKLFCVRLFIQNVDTFSKYKLILAVNRQIYLFSKKVKE